MSTGSAHDFDFLIGEWRVHHRRLRDRLVGCEAWEDFEGSASMQLLLGGQGHVDDNLLHLPAGSYRAVTLRVFDPLRAEWAIWWLDARRPHALDVPVKGRFEGAVGTFLAEDQLDGRPVVVRFRWEVLDPEAPTWEQAFSADGGRTWETNWTMGFTRPAQQG